MSIGPSSVIRKKSPCFNCKTEGCMLGTCKHPKVGDRIKRNIDKFRKQPDAARAAKRVSFPSQEEDLKEEHSIGLEEILVAEIYGAKPTMSTSIVPEFATEPETGPEKHSTNHALESLHARLGRVSMADIMEEPPCTGSATAQDEPSIGEMRSEHSSSF